MAAAFGASLGAPVSDQTETSTRVLTTNVTVPSDGRLVVVVAWYNPGVTASMSGGGLTWAQDTVTLSGTVDTSRHIAIFSANAPSGVASGTALTATFSAIAFSTIYGVYFTGVATSSAKDVASTGSQGTTAAWLTGSNTTTVADEVIVGTSWFDAVIATNTPDGTDTEAIDFNNAIDSSWCMEYRIVASTGSYDVGGTWSTNTGGGTKEWLAIMVAYKAAATSTPADLSGTAAGVGSASGFPSAGVSHLASGVSATAASGSVTAAYPVGLALVADDILICDVSARDNVVVTFPAGWTKKAELNNGTTLRKTVAWKRRAGGDSDVDVAVTHAAGAQIIAKVHVIRGAVATGDPFEATGGPTAVAAATTGTFPSATTVSPGDLLFYTMAYGDDYATGPSITNAQTLTLTERGSTEVP